MTEREEFTWKPEQLFRHSSSASSGSRLSATEPHSRSDAASGADAGVEASEGASEPVWKTNLLVLAGLYPLVMVHTSVVAPHLEFLGPQVALLFGSATTVALLGWPVLPWLRRTFAWWLDSATARTGTDARGGAFLATMIAMTAALFVHVVPRLF